MNKWSTIGVSLLLSFGAMKGDFLAQRRAFCGKGSRIALPAHPACLLGASHQTMQGVGHEYDLPVCFLELP